MPANDPERRYVRIPLTTSYKLISVGFREGIGRVSTGAWRVASVESPATDSYASVATGSPQPLVKDGETWARMETGTGYVELTFL